MTRRSINELARIPFSGKLEQAFASYSKEAEALSVRLAFELEAGAGDSEAAMGSLKGHWYLMGLDTKLRARKVAKRLKRAAELAHGMRGEARKIPRGYRAAFVEPAKARAKKLDKESKAED